MCIDDNNGNKFESYNLKTIKPANAGFVYNLYLNKMFTFY